MSKVINYVIGVVDKTQSTLSQIGAGFKGLAALAAVRWAAGAVRSSIEYVGALKDASDAAGITTENFQALSQAAGQNGVKMDQLTQALMRVRDLQGSVGTDERAAKTFAKLGLSVRDVASTSPDALLKKIADGITRTGDASVAFDLFGKGAGRMLSTMKELSAADWSGLREKFKASILTPEDVAMIDDAGDALDRISTRIKVLGAQGLAGIMRGPGALIDTINMPQTVEGIDAEASMNFWRRKRAERDTAQTAAKADAKQADSVLNDERKASTEAYLFSRTDAGAYEMQMTYLEDQIKALKDQRTELGTGNEVLEARKKLTEKIIEAEGKWRAALNGRTAADRDADAKDEERRRKRWEGIQSDQERRRSEVETKKETRQSIRRYLYSQKTDEEKLKETEDNIGRWTKRVKEASTPTERQAAVQGAIRQMEERDQLKKSIQEKADQDAKDRADKAAEAQKKLAEIKKPSVRNLGISEELAWRNFGSGRDPLSMTAEAPRIRSIADSRKWAGGTIGNQSSLIQNIGESHDEFAARTKASIAERIAKGGSPEEQMTDLAREQRDLLKVIADNVAPPKK